jgi:hypothetical protein
MCSGSGGGRSEQLRLKNSAKPLQFRVQFNSGSVNSAIPGQRGLFANISNYCSLTQFFPLSYVMSSFANASRIWALSLRKALKSSPKSDAGHKAACKIASELAGICAR